MGNVTMGRLWDTTYMLLREYYPVSANIDVNLGYIVKNSELFNRFYYEIAEKDKVSAVANYAQFPIVNLLGETSEQYEYKTHTTTAINYIAASARSYSFEVNGACTAYVKELTGTTAFTTLATLVMTGITNFTTYMGYVPTPHTATDNIYLSFEGNNVYQVKNVGMYAYGSNVFQTSADIPPFKQYVEYSVPSDYMDMNMVEARDQSGYYPNFTDYYQNNGKWFVSRRYSAEFNFHYYRQVSAVSADNEYAKLEIEDKNALLIPYAMAGTILCANGYNMQAGNNFINMFYQKLASVDVSDGKGVQRIYNIKGW